MTHETVLVGPLTRDFTHRGPLRWSQPGGSPWHAGLALRARGGEPSDKVRALAGIGPWGERFALPGLVASGVAWAGPSQAYDLVFRNRYDGGRRDQTLIERAGPISCDVLGDRCPQAAIVSPLLPDDVPPLLLAMLRERGAFVAVDAQGLLRDVHVGGHVSTRPADLAAGLPGACAVKFSERELRVQAGLPDDDPWVPAAIDLAKALGAEIIVSRGARGAAVALPGAARPIEASVPALGGDSDATGAGDILLASYGRARSRGLQSAPAIDRAVCETHAALEARRAAERVPGGVRALLSALRALHGAAALAQHAERRRSLVGECFPVNGAAATAIRAEFPGPLPLPKGVAARAAAVVSACWALFTAGWPANADLAPMALREAAGEAVARLRGPSVASVRSVPWAAPC